MIYYQNEGTSTFALPYYPTGGGYNTGPSGFPIGGVGSAPNYNSGENPILIVYWGPGGGEMKTSNPYSTFYPGNADVFVNFSYRLY